MVASSRSKRGFPEYLLKRWPRVMATPTSMHRFHTGGRVETGSTQKVGALGILPFGLILACMKSHSI